MPRHAVRWLRILITAMPLVACGGKEPQIGAPCSTDGDCGSGDACVYEIAAGCSAKATCQQNPTGTLCGGGIAYCACSGEVIFIGCGSPGGFAYKPVAGPHASANGCDSPDAGGD